MRQCINTVTFYLGDISAPLRNVYQQWCPCICFQKVTIITIYIQLTTTTFRTAIRTKRMQDFGKLKFFRAINSGNFESLNFSE